MALPEIESEAEAAAGGQAGHSAPAAGSTDGRTFRIARAGDRFVAGDVVVLTSGGTRQLGQVHEVRALEAGGEARGVLLGVIGPDGAPDRRRREVFASGTAQPAGASELAALQAAAGAALDVGTWHAGVHELPARLRAAGFNRHTFLCGQSGSGKTYALGVILERLLLDTELRMAVLDPNSDFVGLGDVRGDAPEGAVRRLAAQDVRVLRPEAGGGDPLRLRFATMDRRAQAAILQLDPLADREEYGALLDSVLAGPVREAADVVARLRDSGGQAERALAQRLVNLGIGEWEVWARQDASAVEVLDSGPRAVVMDLGGFRSPQEPLAVTLDVLDHLWRERERRIPTLIVVDEAHNVCGRDAPTPLHAAVTDLVVRIAAEGRKFGLWLLLSTQRPSKIHPQVLSQCDNLLLMRMNSPGDVAELAEVFGFAPPAMLGAAPYFVQGEALAAGTFAPLPSFVRMGARFTPEGGSDVKVPMPHG